MTDFAETILLTNFDIGNIQCIQMAESSDLKQKTARGLLWGGIGSGGMQLLNLAFGIILSRILSPGDYGMIGSLAIFSAVAGIFTESGFTPAIINRRHVSILDYSSVFWFNLVVGATLYLILFFLAIPIANFYGTPQMIPLARFVFLSFFIGALGTAPSAYISRNLQIKRRSHILLASVSMSGIAGVACALAGFGYWGIAVQTVVYSSTLTILLWLSVDWRPKFIFSMSVIRSMLPFSVKQMVVALFNHFNNNFFAVLLAKFYGMRQTGFYTQGNKWTIMGQSTLSGMINSVAQPVMRQAIYDSDRLRRVFRKMLRFASFVSFPAMFGLCIISRELIIISVTDKWLPAVEIMRILCIGSAFIPLATLYGNMFNSINRPGIFMWNTIILGSVQLVTALFTCRYGLYTMLIIYSVINILWLGVWQFFARRCIGLKFRHTLSDILPYLTISLVVMTISCYVASGIYNPILSLAIKIIVAATLYCFIMWISGSVVFKETLSYIKHRNI